MFVTKSLFLPEGAYIPKFFHFNDALTQKFIVVFSMFKQKGIPELTPSFTEESYKLFDQIKISGRLSDRKKRDDLAQFSNKYFENMTIIANTLMESGRYKDAFDFWQRVIILTKDWENQDKTSSIHKGTPYYFAAVAALLSRDFDSALISMHLALQEDKRNAQDWQRVPAYYFLILEDRIPNHFLKSYVDAMIGFLRDRLDGQGNEKGQYKKHYQSARSGSLTYEQLREKFLDNKKISEEIKYFFVYSTIKCWHLRVNQKFNREEKIIAPVIFAHALGPFLITIEMLLKNKYPKPVNHRGSWDFGNIFGKLASDESWTINLGGINSGRDTNFSLWVDNCLSENSLKGDFTLAYGLRNFTFHKIESQQKLWEKFTDVLQAVWNCFFKTIEIS